MDAKKNSLIGYFDCDFRSLRKPTGCIDVFEVEKPLLFHFLMLFKYFLNRVPVENIAKRTGALKIRIKNGLRMNDDCSSAYNYLRPPQKFG